MPPSPRKKTVQAKAPTQRPSPRKKTVQAKAPTQRPSPRKKTVQPRAAAPSMREMRPMAMAPEQDGGPLSADTSSEKGLIPFFYFMLNDEGTRTQVIHDTEGVLRNQFGITDDEVIKAIFRLRETRGVPGKDNEEAFDVLANAFKEELSTALTNISPTIVW